MFRRPPPGKTSGSSGVSRGNYLHLPDQLLLRLRPLMINRILAGSAPDATRLGVIAPLIKNNRRFRPVALLGVLPKVCMARVSDWFLDVIDRHGPLHKGQYEFLLNGFTSTPIEIMTAAIADSRARGKSCHITLMDTTSACDVVSDRALDVGLARIGAPDFFIDWVRCTTTGHRRIVKTRCGISDESAAFDLAGLPQGDPTSPVLWCIVADMAMSYGASYGGGRGGGHELAAEGVVPGVEGPVMVRNMAYADDLTCLDSTKEGLMKTTQAVVSLLGFLNARLREETCLHVVSGRPYLDPAPREGHGRGAEWARRGQRRLGRQRRASWRCYYGMRCRRGDAQRTGGHISE